MSTLTLDCPSHAQRRPCAPGDAMPDHHPEAGDHGAGWRYRGYDVAIRVQPRHAGEYLLMTDVACGGARWSRHRDVAAASASAALCLAREQARALVDALSADGD